MKKEYAHLIETATNSEEAISRLKEIIAILRVECPWDKKQTHETLRACMIEEAYEVVEAININNDENLEEELGDVILQVVFHSNLAEESGRFNLTDVINKECEKMIRRHPHVFLDKNANNGVNSIDKVLEKWENIKAAEKKETSAKSRMDSVPKALPALTRATKIQKTQLMKKYGLAKAVEIQAENMGIESKIIPMSNEESDIKLITDIGELEFHDFLIKHQSQPEVLDIKFSSVAPAGGVVDAIKNSEAVIIGPSNPITSISPILSLGGVREALKDTYVVAVSPIIGSDSVSGPASKFMKALDIEVSSVGVASLYEDFLDNFIIDDKDVDKKQQLNQIVNKVTVTNTIMNNLGAKKNLAQIIMDSIL